MGASSWACKVRALNNHHNAQVLWFPSYVVLLPKASRFIVSACPAGLVQDSINRCDVDLRRDLYNGVLLGGLQLSLPLSHSKSIAPVL